MNPQTEPCFSAVQILSKSYRYDQKEVLTRLIGGRARSARALLDIGAGEGGVAAAIAAMVPRYVAVEEDAGRAASLRAHGLTVHEQRFPCAIPGAPFDLIVSSHSIPEGPVSDYAPFVDAAWSMLAPGGSFLIATFKGPDISPLYRWAAECRDEPLGADPRYAELLRLLSRCGTVALATVVSHVRTDRLDDLLIRFDSWFHHAGAYAEGRLKPEIARDFNARFRRNGQYEIATPHSVVVATKDR